MIQIGDFAQLGQVSMRMLRHYDRIGLLTPAQVYPWAGYRSYSADQLARLNRIVALTDLCGVRMGEMAGAPATWQQLMGFLEANGLEPGLTCQVFAAVSLSRAGLWATAQRMALSMPNRSQAAQAALVLPSCGPQRPFAEGSACG